MNEKEAADGPFKKCRSTKNIRRVSKQQSSTYYAVLKRLKP